MMPSKDNVIHRKTDFSYSNNHSKQGPCCVGSNSKNSHNKNIDSACASKPRWIAMEYWAREQEWEQQKEDFANRISFNEPSVEVSKVDKSRKDQDLKIPKLKKKQAKDDPFKSEKTLNRLHKISTKVDRFLNISIEDRPFKVIDKPVEQFFEILTHHKERILQSKIPKLYHIPQIIRLIDFGRRVCLKVKPRASNQR